MMLGAVTYNVLKDWDLETVITKLEEAQFEAVELRTGHKHGVEPSLTTQERARVRARFEKTKVRLLSYGSTSEFHAADPAVRKKNVEDAKAFVDLAHDTGAWGVKVRPNGFPKEVSREQTIQNVAASLRELGDYAAGKGVEIWMEVHGSQTQAPPVCADIMRNTKHAAVGLCWNSNPTDVVNGSVKMSFDMLRPWIKNCHINELANEKYPYRELFALLRQAKYERYTLMEIGESKEPERFMRYYRALWMELARG
ncbi:MAG: sugar phosphate isomerase/epimerase [Candidatus Solibacter usitatus]|nr:sugar phosphate isomerase/epimerase [Candidatus Solibacter usitatus]